ETSLEDRIKRHPRLTFAKAPARDQNWPHHCWLEQIESLLTDLVSTWEGMLVVTGDMNIHCISPNTPLTRSYNEILQTLSLHQLVSKPTRVTQTSLTLIDHIASNCPHRATLTNVLPCPT
ncbi:Hypothetical predicted protein, partial [Paramuricea clavata]